MTLATSSPLSTPDLLCPFPFGQMDWAITPPAVQDYIETLQGRIHQLQNQVETLTGRLEKTSQTSSKPPSSDSPFQKPKRQRRPSKGGKRGARTGHRGTGPTLLSPTEVHWVEPAPCAWVLYLHTTDNSSGSQWSKIISFHYRERGRHHDSERVVLSASRGRSRVDLPPRSYLLP
jgi:hypothetical protein